MDDQSRIFSYINNIHGYSRNGIRNFSGFPNNHYSPEPSLYENPENQTYDNDTHFRYDYTNRYERYNSGHPIRMRCDNFSQRYMNQHIRYYHYNNETHDYQVDTVMLIGIGEYINGRKYLELRPIHQ